MTTRPDTPTASVLDGALSRWSDGWRWRDGTPEPRVRDLTLREVAPNLRCTTYGDGRCYVEVPATWRAARWWHGGRIDTEAAAAIAELIRDCGEPRAIYADGLAELCDDHRLTVRGWLVPIEQWDAALLEPCGASWDREHESDILARARRAD